MDGNHPKNPLWFCFVSSVDMMLIKNNGLTFPPPAPKKNRRMILQENGAHTTTPYLRKWQERAEDNIAHPHNFVNTFPIALTTLSCARDEF